MKTITENPTTVEKHDSSFCHKPITVS